MSRLCGWRGLISDTMFYKYVCLKQQCLVCRGCAWFSSKSPTAVIPFILPAPRMDAIAASIPSTKRWSTKDTGIGCAGQRFYLWATVQALGFLFAVVFVLSYIYIYLSHISLWLAFKFTLASPSQVRDYRYLSKSVAWSPFFFLRSIEDFRIFKLYHM